MYKWLFIIFLFSINNLFSSNVNEIIEDNERVRILDRGLSNLYRDIEGCEDDYLRCSICMCRFGGNLSHTVSKVLTIGSTFMTGFISIPDIVDDQTKVVIGSVSAVCGIASLALMTFKSYSDDAVENRKQRLKDILANGGTEEEP